jgi:hypothetical protein
MRLSTRQQAALTRLHQYPKLLEPEAVEAFFAFTDRGIYPPRHSLSVLGQIDFDDLVTAHKFGWYSKAHDASIADDFRKGLLFLYDFEYSWKYPREQALRLYKEVFGETTHYRQVQDWWEGHWFSRGWLSSWPEGFPSLRTRTTQTPAQP